MKKPWDSKSHFMELYQTKQAIDRLFSQEKGQTYPIEKTVLDQKGSQAPSYNLAVYDFLKGLYGELDKATEARQQDQHPDRALRANPVALATSRRPGQTNCLLKQVWLSLEMRRIQTRLLQVDKLCYAKSVTPLKSKNKSKQKSLRLGMSPFINSSITN